MWKVRKAAVPVLAALSLVAFATPASAGRLTTVHPRPHGYQLVLLSWPGGSGEASALNDRGDVVGYESVADGSIHPFLWRDGTITDLGVLPGADYDCVASDINNVGEVVGSCSVNGGALLRAFMWRRGVMTDLGTLGGTIAAAEAINDRSQIVGLSSTAANVWHAFRWEHSTMIDLGLESAADINNGGEVVGGSSFGGQWHAYRWYRGMTNDLGVVAGADYSTAAAVNDNGSIVGSSADTASQEGLPVAFVWRDGTLTRLPSLGGAYSAAVAVNSRDQILGATQDAVGAVHNVLWQGGSVVDLSTLGIPYGPSDGARVRDINDHGLIAGSYYLVDGRQVPALFR